MLIGECARNPGRRGFLAAIALGSAATVRVIRLGTLPSDPEAAPTKLPQAPKIQGQLYPDGTPLKWESVSWDKVLESWTYTAVPIDIKMARAVKGIFVRLQPWARKLPFKSCPIAVNAGDVLCVTYTLTQESFLQCALIRGVELC